MTDLPEAGDRGVPRYSPRSLPPYRYVPGVRPHPTRDPTGHSYEPSPALHRHAPWDPTDWRTLDDWLYGIDLFNRFYFWEAHEAWEGLWAVTPRDSALATMLQGLIQVAAALLKTHMGVGLGARVLAFQGLEKLRQAATIHPTLLGLDLVGTAAQFSAYFAPLDRAVLPAIGGAVPVLRLAGDG